MELAYLGGMVVIEFEGYGALRGVSKALYDNESLAQPWSCLGRH